MDSSRVSLLRFLLRRPLHKRSGRRGSTSSHRDTDVPRHDTPLARRHRLYQIPIPLFAPDPFAPSAAWILKYRLTRRTFRRHPPRWMQAAGWDREDLPCAHSYPTINILPSAPPAPSAARRALSLPPVPLAPRLLSAHHGNLGNRSAAGYLGDESPHVPSLAVACLVVAIAPFNFMRCTRPSIVQGVSRDGDDTSPPASPFCRGQGKMMAEEKFQWYRGGFLFLWFRFLFASANDAPALFLF